MKKSIIISALAALALNASAADVKPYGFRYADIRTAEPLYPVFVADGEEYINAEGIYCNFKSTGANDQNSWVTYKLDGRRHVDNKDLTVPAASIRVFGDCFYWDAVSVLPEIGFAGKGKVVGTADYKGAKVTYSDKYYTYILKNDEQGGTTYMPAVYELISQDGKILAEKVIYTSSQLPDGSYMVTEPADVQRVPGTELDVALPLNFKFIQQDQYEFQLLAQEAADFVNSTNYVGGAYDRIVAAITTQGTQWNNQKAELADAYDTFMKQVLGLNVDIDNCMFGDKVDMGISGDGERYLAISGAPFDNFTVHFESYDEDGNATIDRMFWSVAEEQPTQLDENGNAIVKICYRPYNSVQLEKHLNVNNAIACVTIEKAASTFKSDEAGYPHRNIQLKKAVNGIDPAMSFELEDGSNIAEDGKSLLIEKNIDVDVKSCTQPAIVNFYTAGYNVEGTVTEGILDGETTLPTVAKWGDDADKFNVEIRKVASRRPGLDQYQAIVSLISDACDNYSCEIEIGDGYNPDNHITIWANAGNADIAVINAKNDEVKATDILEFPYNGGDAIVRVAYNNFIGVNANENIHVSSSNAEIFNPEFFRWINDEEDKEYKGAVSEPLNGMGYIFLNIHCAPADPADNTGVETAEIKVWVNNVEKTFKVRRTDPTIFAYGDYGMGLTFDDAKYVDGYVYEEVEFYVQNCINYYNVLNDLVVETDLPHIFEVCPVSYIHNGHMSDNYVDNNEYHANLGQNGVNDPSQFLVKVRIKYIPTHNVVYDGNLHIYLKGCPDEDINIALHGYELSPAVFAAIHGTATGLNKVEAENANGEMYNVAGQRVNNAKGIVIMNGNKYVK